MKLILKLLLMFVLVAVAGIALLMAVPATSVVASEPAPVPAAATPTTVGDASVGDEDSPLDEAMAGLQGGMRALRGLSKGTDDKAACLKVLQDMQASAIAALQLEPHTPEGQAAPDAEGLAVWKLGFKRQIVTLIDKLLELEIAVQKGNFDALKAGYGALNEIKSAGHYEYQ